MTRNIETPRISEILWEEFMKPLGIKFTAVFLSVFPQNFPL